MAFRHAARRTASERCTASPHPATRRRLAVLALACALLAATALPAVAAAPPAAVEPTASAAAAPGGLSSWLADWVYRLLGEPDPPPPEGDDDVLGNRTGPAGPLIDPDGYAPKDPRPQEGHGRRR